MKRTKENIFYDYTGKKVSIVPYIVCLSLSIILFGIALLLIAYKFVYASILGHLVNTSLYYLAQAFTFILAIILFYFSQKLKPTTIMINEQKKFLEDNLDVSNRFLYDDKHRVVIDLHLDKDYDFETRFTTKVNPLIDGDLAAFLEDSVSYLDACQHLFLRIFWKEYDEKKEARFKEALKNYYVRKYMQTDEEIKRLFFTTFRIGIFGVLFYIISFFVFGSTGHGFVAGIFEGAGMVLIWESVHLAFIEYQDFHKQEARYLMLANMEIDSFDML